MEVECEKILIKIMIIDDDEEQLELLNEEFNMINEKNNKHQFIISKNKNFLKGMRDVQDGMFDILILDWRDEKQNNIGKQVLESIINTSFVPVTIYSAYTTDVDINESFFCRVVDKGAEGFDKLIENLMEIIQSELFIFKKDLEPTIISFLKNFWRHFYENWADLKKQYTNDDIKLLILNRLSFALSREKFKHEDFYDKMKGHPFNYYIYPPFNPMNYNFEVADIIKQEKVKQKTKDDKEEIDEKEDLGDFYVILTPTCDFANDKVDKVLIAKIIELQKLYDEKITQTGRTKTKMNFHKEISKNMRYFFLPKTIFIPNSFVDFQNIKHLELDVINNNFTKVANLSYPFAQSLTSNFTVYYNRIGYEDMNFTFILDNS